MEKTDSLGFFTHGSQPQDFPMKSGFSLDGLKSAITTAIAIGRADRTAATLSRAHHEARLIAPDRLTEEAQIRFLSVIGDVADKIRMAVGTSMTWDEELVVPVMELSLQEYPGPAMRSPTYQPVETLSVDNLQYAAPMVLAYLEEAGLQPHLKYVYNGDIRRYSLQIAIRIHAEKSERLD